MAFRLLEPWAYGPLDYYFSRLEALLRNRWRDDKKHPEVFEPSEFLPDHLGGGKAAREPVELTPEQGRKRALFFAEMKMEQSKVRKRKEAELAAKREGWKAKA